MCRASSSTVRDQRIMAGKLISLDGILLAGDNDLSLWDLMSSLIFCNAKCTFQAMPLSHSYLKKCRYILR